MYSILLCCLNGDHTQKDLNMFWLYTTYGIIKLLKSLYILDASPITNCRILDSFLKIEDFFNLKKTSFVDVDGLILCWQNGGNS
jgi:hypothetical protein